MSTFNAKASRTKRPCPIWVDAFQRDTQDLSAEEVGAYFLLLMAMWTRESCDLPDDDNRLARICRVSPTLWKRRLGPLMRSFLIAGDGVLSSKRLQKEAKFTELSVTQQSDRKSGKSHDKSLKSNGQEQSGDEPGMIHGKTPEDPTQQPNNLQRDDDDSAGEANGFASEFHFHLIDAVGDGFDTASNLAIADGWLRLPGLDAETIIRSAAETLAAAPDPVSSLAYCTAELRKLSEEITNPPPPPEPHRRADAKGARPVRDMAERMKSALERVNEDGSLRQ